MMIWLELFPELIQSLLRQLPASIFQQMEEIRMREGRPLEINTAQGHYFLQSDGGLTHDPDKAYKPSRQDSHRLLDRISNHSLYTMEEELRKGFITIPGGHRVGLSGRTVLNSGRVEHIRDISSFNVRIAKEVIGAADVVLPFIQHDKGRRMKHTLICSPPQHGKTTMIRDLARQISSGKAFGGRGMKVGIVDERSEIAGCLKGIPSFDVGPRTDVMDACPKAEGMMMMIRSMSPDVLMVDEVGRPEDVEALQEALHAGITVIATAHGSSMADLKRKPGIGSLISSEMFELYIMLRRQSDEYQLQMFDQQQRQLQIPTSHAAGKRR